MRRTALADILGVDFSSLHDDALYRNLDRLHPNRERIETELAEREKTLFHLDDTLYLYDLTSTYFEGQAESNPQAKRGYSRDKRPDCKQVLVGLVLDRDGFLKHMKSSTATARTVRRWERCWIVWRSAPARKRAPRWWWIAAWPMRKIGRDSGAWISLSCGGPAAGTKCVARRVRAERRLGRGDPSAFAAQSRSGESQVASSVDSKGRRFTFSA